MACSSRPTRVTPGPFTSPTEFPVSGCGLGPFTAWDGTAAADRGAGSRSSLCPSGLVIQPYYPDAPATASDAGTPATTETASPAVEQQMTAAENTLNAVAAQTPAFVSRYRNLNLLMVGLQMTSSVPQQIVDLKQAFAAIKAGSDPNARATAAGEFSTKLQGLLTFMNTNFHSPLIARKK